ncbi:Superfamily II helicase [Pyrenophora tritici-repentis]|uniref:RNA helicase n=2 Tax=Pyrenophora tritici-repentis TaxID=45151 RepID=A0A2W1DUW0_9PLEO|nr:ATP-dependent RNA helicase SUV3, mitochondrial precursor [Pyrenophora tritici-repentis Pt-1C-BFP]KAA8627612.1 ATP-dependent RNA helicase SUV3 mitochondrial precursor [Pyrenophora tritici-repentis]EDU42082.1 ATP-dependent RNA helicase SUV3, mitochondrial precursor [Pyrenophora tritici-repentis Pt-1C-BFP]KAF7442359.1 ATP-dependent RNA helicase SUV3 mitochondrial precursor [Pyrenophora tritici-repentis]KAF7579270.1 Superfamily II helicase [Pyrenophora tritici-repentis]KAI0585598.1 ATP-dependen
MLSLPTRRNSLCLFCASAARSPASKPQRLLPRTQVAYRVQSRKPARKQPQFNPRRPDNPFQIYAPNRHLHNPFEAIRHVLAQVERNLGQAESLRSLQITTDEYDTVWLSFQRSINKAIREATPEVIELAEKAKEYPGRVQAELRQRFYHHLYAPMFTPAEKDNQKHVADLRYPAEWYPATRGIQRTVHMHVGPTNSGKTYHALKRLEEVDSGIYLGPLRLLAHEVYTRLNAKGKPCALVTGEEQRMPDDTRARMFSCTVEMAPLNTPFDVAVIDEIQMISHQERGWAWTQAFLGLQAREIHLCGEARTVPIMRELCALVGDKVHVHEYNRLTPLQPMDRSLQGNLNLLEKGDCVVAFSVLAIHALRRLIERKTGKKCAIVYGGLPPETRAQQARLFNDPDNDYDYLVASDAIGMGLNLAIKRVIFETTVKNNGEQLVPLQISEIKQIAGRAGRYKTAHQAITKDSEKASVADTAIDPVIGLDDKQPDTEEVVQAEPQTVGWATTLERNDLVSLKAGMNKEPEAITSAGLFPPSVIVERFASYFPPGTPFSYILLRLHTISEMNPRFHLCALREQLAIADVLHPLENLSIQDRITLCAAPVSSRKANETKFLKELATYIADGKSGSILDCETLPLGVMDVPLARTREYLRSLEDLHKMIVCYLWLSYRFPNILTTRSLANHMKKLVEDKIEYTLTQFSFTEESRLRIKKEREIARKLMDTPKDTDEEVSQASPSPEQPEVTANISSRNDDDEHSSAWFRPSY